MPLNVDGGPMAYCDLVLVCESVISCSPWCDAEAENICGNREVLAPSRGRPEGLFICTCSVNFASRG